MSVPLICIVGPTAVGKTAAAVDLALKLNAQIISCDSMLVYKEPRIITAAPPPEALQAVPHHLIGIISVTQDYNVFTYYQQAGAKIIELLDKKVPAIVCGGTGLYFKAILDGIFDDAGKDAGLRNDLESEAQAQGVDKLYARLQSLDPEAAAKISPADQRRIVRALEVYYASGKLISQKKKESRGLWGKVPIKIFGFDLPRPRLYEIINQRVEQMWQAGAVEEVKELSKLELSPTAGKIIGIKEISSYLSGAWPKEQAIDEMKRNTRRLAKRQMTWFKADKRLEWLDVDGLSAEQAADVMFEKIKNVTFH